MTSDHDREGGEVPQGERDDRPELDVDTAFAAIVAGFGDETAGGVGPWPAAEDLSDEPRADGPDRTGGSDLVDPVGPVEPTDRTRDDGPDDGWGAGAGPDRTDPLVLSSGPSTAPFGTPGEVIADDEGYVPPEPPPLPRGDLVSRLAWAGVVGGPVFLLLAAVVWQELPKSLLLAALAAFVGGFVTLVARMPGDSPDEPDDGAVV